MVQTHSALSTPRAPQGQQEGNYSTEKHWQREMFYEGLSQEQYQHVFNKKRKKEIKTFSYQAA